MFIPPFCPNAACKYHIKPPDSHWYQRKGTYSTLSAGVIPRFRCSHCGRGFSARTFSLDYFTKKRIDYRRLLSLLSSSMGLRQISRFTGLSPNTINNRFERLGRQAIALSEAVLANHQVDEDLVADEFETFSVSQYFPEYYHLLVGKRSQFLYFFTHMCFKRKGHMTAQQKMIREALYQKFTFPRGRQTRSFGQVMDKITRIGQKKELLTLHTDEKQAYRHAIKRNDVLRKREDEGSFQHFQTSSKVLRNQTNPLFSVNYLDRELRKDQASQTRETVRFNRNVCSGLFRVSCYFLYHNFIKRYRINDPVGIERRHFQEAGIDTAIVEDRLNTLFQNRIFLSREKIVGFGYHLWVKKILTPLKKKPEYVPGYAVA